MGQGRAETLKAMSKVLPWPEPTIVLVPGGPHPFGPLEGPVHMTPSSPSLSAAAHSLYLLTFFPSRF